MADAAVTSLITGGTAVLSGLLGYATARGQQLNERARITSEVKRATDEYERSVLEKRRAEQQERVARREALYLEYLNALDDYVVMVLDHDVTPSRFTSWWSHFQTLDNQMDLYATNAVAEANRGVYQELAAVSGALSSTQTFSTDVRRLFSQHRHSFEDARSRLVQAMRGEVWESPRMVDA